MSRDIIEITQSDARRIINNRSPRGLFRLIEDGKYVGIDNMDGHAWTESFDCRSKCDDWLRGTGTKEDHKG